MKEKKCKECKEDFIIITKQLEKDNKELKDRTLKYIKELRKVLNEQGKEIRRLKSLQNKSLK